MVEIPAYLLEVDRILTAYGRWARDRPTYHRCGSAEGRYRSTDVHVGVSAPVILIADWSAAQVQRSLNGVPTMQRRLLTAWYVPGRGQERRIRQAKRGIGRGQFESALVEALIMFRNVHAATCKAKIDAVE